MKILVTGSARGIGLAASLRYLDEGHEVIGIDILSESDITTNSSSPTSEAKELFCHAGYTHFRADIRDAAALPDIPDVEVIFSNAGRQNSDDDIGHNLKGAINVTEKYIADNSRLRSVLFNASASSVSGQEFPEYAASKSGLLGYMRNLAIRLAPQKVTVNAISLGGVITDSNNPVMSDPKLWKQIMSVTPMKKWTSLDEVCDWVLFLTLKNRSMSGQNILIDNGEKDLNPTFVWP